MVKHIKIVFDNDSCCHMDGSEEAIIRTAFMNRSRAEIRSVSGDVSLIDFGKVMSIHIQTEEGMRTFAEWDRGFDAFAKELWPDEDEEREPWK